MKKGWLLPFIAFSFLLNCSFLGTSKALAVTPELKIGAFLPFYGADPPPDPWTIANFETNTNHHLDIFLWYQYWTQQGIDADLLRPVASAGHTIELAWEPIDVASGQPCEGQVSLAAIADPNSPLGACYEANYIRPWAQSLADFKDPQGNQLPVLFRPMSEMNYPWTDWGTNNPTNSSFIDAWRHLHDVFIQEGATNVKWLWSPNRDETIGTSSQPETAEHTYSAYYPIDAYVDIIGIDGYNLGCYGEWYELEKVFGPSYDVFAHHAPGKEIMLAETGSTEYLAGWGCGGVPAPNKPDWIKKAYNAWIPYRFPKVTRATWYSGIDESAIDFRINSTSNSTTAYNSAMQSLYDGSFFMNFYDNQYAYDWILAANPGALNNQQPIPANLYVKANPQN